MLGSVKPNSLELRADSLRAATAYPKVFLVQVSPKSDQVLRQPAKYRNLEASCTQTAQCF